jgi:hypothetical protein
MAGLDPAVDYVAFPQLFDRNFFALDGRIECGHGSV